MVDEKLQLRDWLLALLEVNKIPGLEWVDKDKQIFGISWRHGRKKGWTSDIDSKLFKEWAVYKKRYRPGDDGRNAKLWKSRFRCALNALQDVRELKTLSKTSGENAKKIYQFIQKTQVTTRSRRRKFVKRGTYSDFKESIVVAKRQSKTIQMESNLEEYTQEKSHHPQQNFNMDSCWPFSEKEEIKYLFYETFQDGIFETTDAYHSSENKSLVWNTTCHNKQMVLPNKGLCATLIWNLDEDDTEANKTIEDFLSPKAKYAYLYKL